MGTIILFYKYIGIMYPKRILKWQKQICAQLGLKGRVILGHEGINGTLGGPADRIERYKVAMDSHELFGDIDFKTSCGSADDFPRLYVAIRDEIVHLGISHTHLPARDGGLHLKPAQAHALIVSQPDDLVLLDARNTVESAIGAFDNAIKPPINHFRELPAFIDHHADLFKNKQVLMYCTGGIRCERASGYVKRYTQARAVYQIEGGIHRYVEQYPDGFFRGKNYVFDGRISVSITPDILAHCLLCKQPCDDYTNCVNATCNKHFLCCSNCIAFYNNACGLPCRELVMYQKVAKRPMINTRAITSGQ